MKNERSEAKRKKNTVGCWVLGDKVRVSVSYRRSDMGVGSLVDFGCDMYGRCGITAWDPCPVYVGYMENILPVPRD